MRDLLKLAYAVSCSAIAVGLTSGAQAQVQAPSTVEPQQRPPAATATTPAGDASATAPGNDAIDIVVTARRVQERLQDVPISVTVFNQQQVSNRNIINAGDLATYTPSLATNPNYGTEFTSFAIRGFVQDPSTAPSVGVYFADVVAPRGPTQGTQAGDGAGPGSLFDLQNVQILKGPQGTLFGRNTTGGAVLFVPQKPTSRLEGYLEGSYGNYNYRRVQGAINLPLSDVARLRISGDYQGRDGYLKNDAGIGPGDFNDVNYYSLRGSLVVDLTSNLENYTIVSYTKSHTNGSTQKQIACSTAYTLGSLLACPQQQREAGSDFYTVSSNVPNATSRLESWQAINTTTWQATDHLTVKNIASYSQLRQLQRTVLFGNDWRFGVPALGIPVRQFAFSLINPETNRNNVDQSTFTEEFQLQGNGLDGRFTWQAGGYFEDSEPLRRVGTVSPTLLSCVNSSTLTGCQDVLGIAFSAASSFAFPVSVGGANHTIGETRFRDVGVYSQASYALTSKLKLTGGIRYTWDRVKNVSTRYNDIYPTTPPFTQALRSVCTDNRQITYNGGNCLAFTQQKSSAPTWLVDLDYKPVDDILLYAKWTRGYRAGGLQSQSPVNYRTFGPEKVEAYEAGLKATFRGPISGTFNVAGFYNDFTNQQIQAGFFAVAGSGLASTAGPVNAGKSRIYGGEVDASVSPIRNVAIDASYTYLDAQIRSISPIATTDPNYTISYQIQPGDPLLLSPRNKFSITPRYTLPLGDGVGNVTFAATVAHTDHVESNYAYLHNATQRANYGGVDLGRIPGYTLVNVNVDWRNVFGQPIDLSGFVTNVTQKRYLVYTAGLGQVGFESAVLGQPRFYGVRVRYRFGQ